MQNKKQKEFIRAIERSAEKASYAFCQIQEAYKITGIATPEREKYLEALQSYMHSCNKMILEINIAFGENSETLSTRAAGINARLPHTLN